MANNAPDTVSVQRGVVGLLVLIELVVGQDLEGEACTEDEDGQVVCPLDRSGQRRSSTAEKSSVRGGFFFF